MNRNEAVLGKLADWRPPEGRQSLTISGEAGVWATTLTVDRADQVGCLVWELSLRKGAPAAFSLNDWAKRVAERSTGLLESLKVVEIDAVRGEALLRSESPVARAEQVSYYEVLLGSAGHAALRRFVGPRIGPGKRQQTAFALTHEAIAKLAFDLSDAQ
jgi:hypothetical protein